MLTCCNTARGRLACGLGGVLIAVLALACLWAFSPSVTAGDDPLPPPRERGTADGKKTTCPDDGLPIMPPVGVVPPLPPISAPSAKKEVPPPPPGPPPVVGLDELKPVRPSVESAPPPPPGPITPVGAVAPVPQAQTPVDSQDIKQLVAHLGEIRADRAKLDEKERQTIQTIRRKYQEQKHALEQMERELHQLGINFDEAGSGGAP